MGPIIGMIEPDKVAFSVKMTVLNGIYRKPPQESTTNQGDRHLGRGGLEAAVSRGDKGVIHRSI